MTATFQSNWRLRVREVAEEKGMTKETLASLAHLPQESIDHLWSDPTSDVWLSTLSQLADALQVRLTTLLSLRGDALDRDHPSQYNTKLGI